MALLWMDGFDWYTGGRAGLDVDQGPVDKLYEHTQGYSFNAGGRHGGNYGVGVNSGFLRKTISNTTTIVMGVAFTIRSDNCMFSALDNGAMQWFLAYNPNTNRLELRRGVGLGPNHSVSFSAGAFINQSTVIPASNQWRYVEAKVTIGAAGAYEVRVDGLTVMSGVGNTQNTANSFANQITPLTGGGTAWADDFYALDTAGGVNDDFLGDVSVYALSPNQNGYLNEWVPVTLPANWQNVALPLLYPVPSGHNASPGVGKIDAYKTAVLPQNGTVFGVQSVGIMQRDDAMFHQGRVFLRVAGGNYESPDLIMADGYMGVTRMDDVNPATAGAWTKAVVDTLEVGVKET